jgi:hypothetical protein
VIYRASGSGSPGLNGIQTAITLTDGTFTNAAANTDNLIHANGTYTAPHNCDGIDGKQTHHGNFATPVSPPAGAIAFLNLVPVARIGLGAGTHTITVLADNACTGAGETGTLTLRIDTVDLL